MDYNSGTLLLRTKEITVNDISNKLQTSKAIFSCSRQQKSAVLMLARFLHRSNWRSCQLVLWRWRRMSTPWHGWFHIWTKLSTADLILPLFPVQTSFTFSCVRNLPSFLIFTVTSFLSHCSHLIDAPVCLSYKIAWKCANIFLVISFYRALSLSMQLLLNIKHPILFSQRITFCRSKTVRSFILALTVSERSVHLDTKLRIDLRSNSTLQQ